MKKLLLFLIFLPSLVRAQQGYWPSVPAGSTPATATINRVTGVDSLAIPWLQVGNKYYGPLTIPLFLNKYQPLYARRAGGNNFSGLQYFNNGSTQGLMNGSRFHGEAAFIDVGVNPEFKVVGGRPIKITSGFNGYLVARGDSLTDSQGNQFVKSQSGGDINIGPYAYQSADGSDYTQQKPTRFEATNSTTQTAYRPDYIESLNFGTGFKLYTYFPAVTGGNKAQYYQNKTGVIALIGDSPDSTTIANTYLSKTAANVITGNIRINSTDGYPGYSTTSAGGFNVYDGAVSVRQTGNSNVSAGLFSFGGLSLRNGNKVFGIDPVGQGFFWSNETGSGVYSVPKPDIESKTGEYGVRWPLKLSSAGDTLAVKSDIVKAIGSRPDSAGLALTYLKKSGGTMTGDLILHSANPTDPLSAAPKVYIDNLITGITWKNAVRVKTTANITLSGTQTVDAVALAIGNRVLVSNQTDQTQNGIYVVASGAWNRANDADTGDELLTSTVLVTAGTQGRNTQWTCLNIISPTIGTDAITYGQMGGAGTYSASSGVNLAANVFTLDQTFTRGLFSVASGTGISYNNATGQFQLSGIPNASLANNTISGTPLGSSLGGLSAGTGLSGTTYNGSAAQTFSVNQAFAPIWTGLHTHQFNNLGAVSASAALLQNTTAAASGTQQYSPALEFAGNGYGTTGAASQSVSFRMFATPIQGNTANGNLTFEFSRAGGAWSQLATLSNTGRWNAESFALFQAGLGTTGRDGVILNNTSAATSGVPVQYSPRLRWLANALNTSSSTSGTIEWTAEVRPTSGSNISSNFVISSSNNGAAYVDRLTINETGDLYSTRGVYATRGNFGATSNDGFVLSNGTSATAGVPVQYSNRLRFLGAAWNTSGTPASNAQEAIMELRPSSGSATGSTLALAFQNNNGGFIDRVTIDNVGNIITGIGSIRSGSRVWANTSTSLGAALGVGSTAFTTSGAPGPVGFGLAVQAFTATSTTSSGTIPVAGFNTFNQGTFAASSATTLTNASTVYISGPPIAGDNVSITNGIALHVNAGNSLFGGSIQSAGRIAATSTVKTANYTASAADEIIQCNSSAGSFNVTLPTGATQGTILTIDNIEGTANAVTVVGTINAATNYTLNALKSVTLYKTATGSNTWKIRFNN